MFPVQDEHSLKSLLSKRIQILLQPYDIDMDNEVQLDQAIQILQSLKGSDAAKILKTWLNGWTTTSRMHEEIQMPCLLGCQGQPDSLQHYIHCPYCFALTSFLIPATSNYPLVRLGLVLPTQSFQLSLSCIFTAYHAVKKSCNSIHLQDGSLTTSQFRHNWEVFASAFLAEAGAMDLQCKAYTFPKFFQFLVNKGCPQQPCLPFNSNLYSLHDHQPD